MNCPHCSKQINIGKLIGSVRSHRKSASSKANGKKGGRTRIAASLAINKPRHTLGACDVRYPLSDVPARELKAEIISRRCQASFCHNPGQELLVDGFKAWLCVDHQIKKSA